MTIKPIKSMTYIFDIDGVLSNPKQRIHLYKNILNASSIKEKGLAIDKFVEDCHLDEPFKDVCDLCYKIGRTSQVIFLTGRAEKFRKKTKEWLELHTNTTVRDYMLIMKPEGDTRNSIEWKKEVYENTIEKKYNVVGVFEDRADIVKMWQSLGLTVYALPSLFALFD